MKKNQENQENQSDQEEQEKTSVGREILSWVLTIACAFLIALVLDKFVIVNANVPSGSMENTIQVKDRLIGWRLAYLTEEPRRGDIIMFKFPVNEKEIYIKRLIGLPGETLDIREGKVYINGSDEPLNEDYLKEEWVIANDGFHFEIPQGCYFMMGDNRNNSADGRYWAAEAVDEGLAADEQDAVEKGYCFVKREKMLGKAVLRYFPNPTTFKDVEY